MKYKIIKEENPEKLEKKVNELILKGWKPQGGVAFQILPIGGVMKGTTLQAMVKAET